MAFKMDNDNSDEILAEINVTPLIDIMLVLLIIFMLTSSIALESGLDIDLPKTTSVTGQKEGSAILISLDRAGTISVQGRKIVAEHLEKEIAAAIRESHSDLVVFEGDQKSYLGRAIQIMDVAKAAGAKKFAIATEQVDL